MSKHYILISAAVISLFSVVATSFGSGFEYEVIDLGTLGGDSAEVYGINNAGQVVGSSGNHAYIWQDGEMTDIGILGGTNATAFGINNLGQVVGASERAFYWDSVRGMVELSVPPPPGQSQFNIAFSINDSGQIVVTSQSQEGVKAYVFDGPDGEPVDIGSLGAGGYAIAYGNNNLGQVVGGSLVTEPREMVIGFVWQDGVMTELPTLGGGNDLAIHINDQGTIVGWSSDTGGIMHAVMWVDGEIVDLGTDGSEYGNIAIGINNSGVVVGQFEAPGGDARAFIYRDGVTSYLDELIDPAPGYSLAIPWGINDNGWITVNAINAAGHVRALLLVPAVQIVGIEIAGPNEIVGACQTQYSAIASYDDSSTRDVTARTLWSVEPGDYATIDDDGLLTTELVYEPAEMVIYAWYVEDSQGYGDEMFVAYTPPVTEYYVDGANGDDNNDGLSRQMAFATIQHAIDTAAIYGDIVWVLPGVYAEAISFEGKAITVAGLDGAPIIETPGDFAVSFYNGEGPESVLKNFVIRNSFMAIFIAGSSPTLHNLNILDNLFGIEAYVSSAPDIRNCIFFNNTEDLFQCESHYSFFESDSATVEGLISYWKFDETQGSEAFDSVGENHGVVNAAQWSEGQVGGALYFDGSGDYVNLGNVGLLADKSSFSISAWVNVTDFRSRRTVYSEGNSNDIYPTIVFRVLKNSDGAISEQLQLLIRDDNRQISAVTYGSKFPSGWHHVVGIKEANVVTLYLDGIGVSNEGEALGSITVNGVAIGRSRVPGYTEYFMGSVDEVLMFEKALSDTEVQQLYQTGLASESFMPLIGPGFADPNNDDYHLLSERGRYWSRHDVWVLDNVTSPCIDGGDPAGGPVDEPVPNGARINIGAFGGTAYASMSDSAGRCDLNHDGIVNVGDLAMLAAHWLNAED